MIQKLQKYYKV